MVLRILASLDLFAALRGTVGRHSRRLSPLAALAGTLGRCAPSANAQRCAQEMKTCHRPLQVSATKPATKCRRSWITVASRSAHGRRTALRVGSLRSAMKADRGSAAQGRQASGAGTGADQEHRWIRGATMAIIMQGEGADLFESEADILVNTVDTQGVMGARHRPAVQAPLPRYVSLRTASTAFTVWCRPGASPSTSSRTPGPRSVVASSRTSGEAVVAQPVATRVDRERLAALRRVIEQHRARSVAIRPGLRPGWTRLGHRVRPDHRGDGSGRRDRRQRARISTDPTLIVDRPLGTNHSHNHFD